MISPEDCTCFQAWLEAGVWWGLSPAWSLDCGTVCERARGGGSGGLCIAREADFLGNLRKEMRRLMGQLWMDRIDGMRCVLWAPQ